MRTLQLLQRARTASSRFYDDGPTVEVVDNPVILIGMLLYLVIALAWLPFHLALKLVPPCEHPRMQRWKDYGGDSNVYCPDCKYRD